MRAIELRTAARVAGFDGPGSIPWAERSIARAAGMEIEDGRLGIFS
jgi:hypothetical protein